jgi:hypothetical protein
MSYFEPRLGGWRVTEISTLNGRLLSAGAGSLAASDRVTQLAGRLRKLLAHESARLEELTDPELWFAEKDDAQPPRGR